jgi:8-oxo-dGTP pyrophosphatase MutT (NUDIX family)
MPDESKIYHGQVSEHAVIFNEYGEILLIQHNGGGQGAKAPDFTNPHCGKWHFPGGRMDYDDQPGEGLQREILEETGLTNVELILPCYACRWGFSEPIKYSMIYLARVSGRPDAVLPDDECSMAWQWIDWQKALTLPLLSDKHPEIIRAVAGWAKRLGVLASAD